jgi:hypothetical protein
MKISRRRLMQSAVIGAGAALSPAALAQTPAQPAAPETDFLAAARDQARRNAEALAKADLPMSTEPAFSFKA